MIPGGETFVSAESETVFAVDGAHYALIQANGRTLGVTLVNRSSGVVSRCRLPKTRRSARAFAAAGAARGQGE